MSRVRLAQGPWRAEIDPALGGNITSLEWNGQAVLQPIEAADDPYLYGAPLLLPANRTRCGRFRFEGRDYALPVNEPAAPAHLHGRVHDAPFELRRADGACAELQLNAGAEIYPFPFRLELCYRLTEDGLTADYAITNTGDRAMPLTFGLHTTFVAPEFFSVPIDREQERDARNLPTGIYRPLDAQQQAFADGCDPRGMRISGYFASAGTIARIGRFRYAAEGGFDHWVLYNGGGNRGYLCVEPQCGAVDGLNLPGGRRVLAPGESLKLRTRLERM